MEQLGKILARLQLRGPGPLQQRAIESAVQEVLGETAGRNLRVGTVRRRSLVLLASSAARAFELEAFRKQELLQRLREVDGLEQLKHLKIKVGSWRDDGRGQVKS